VHCVAAGGCVYALKFGGVLDEAVVQGVGAEWLGAVFAQNS